jgi:hypothetical protein
LKKLKTDHLGDLRVDRKCIKLGLAGVCADSIHPANDKDG